MNEAEELAKATRDLEIAKQIYKIKSQIYGEALKKYDEKVQEEIVDDSNN